MKDSFSPKMFLESQILLKSPQGELGYWGVYILHPCEMPSSSNANLNGRGPSTPKHMTM
jgi:hypothetical protein